MLKQVQHDMTVRFQSFCHPEPGPELNSGSNDFGISVLGLENFGFKAPPCGRGSLLPTKFLQSAPSKWGRYDFKMIQPTEVDLIIKNAAELLTLSPSFKEEAGLGVIRNGAVAIQGEKIFLIGKTEELPKEFCLSTGGQEIDATGKVVMPGLIDSHTHLIFAGSRENEFEQRIEGHTYLEIAERGGGILSTVEATRKASFDELLYSGKRRLDRLLSKGVTTIEAKSGYGLSLEGELKILRVMKALQEDHPVGIVPTFLGAHTIPKEFKNERRRYMDLLTQEMIPEVAGERLAEFCDVFCEEKAFNLEESREILETGKRYGLKPKIHADQLSPGGGAELAAAVGASSADHLEYW